MVEIKNFEVYGLERAINASYNPMSIGDIDTTKPLPENWTENRKKLTSVPVGSGHDTCLSGILVTFDIKYPLYWTPQAQRYHWLQIVSSQSKMHRLMKMGKDQNFDKMFDPNTDARIIKIVQEKINYYNQISDEIMQQDPDKQTIGIISEQSAKLHKAFYEAIASLPAGFEMWETCTTNYQQLKTIYFQRKNHKLTNDWGPFCKMIENLPYFKQLILDPMEAK